MPFAPLPEMLQISGNSGILQHFYVHILLSDDGRTIIEVL